MAIYHRFLCIPDSFLIYCFGRIPTTALHTFPLQPIVPPGRLECPFSFSSLVYILPRSSGTKAGIGTSTPVGPRCCQVDLEGRLPARAALRLYTCICLSHLLGIMAETENNLRIDWRPPPPPSRSSHTFADRLGRRSKADSERCILFSRKKRQVFTDRRPLPAAVCTTEGCRRLAARAHATW